jgi:2-oxoglutarate ferredoxin oxidoreductase subunit delta
MRGNRTDNGKAISITIVKDHCKGCGFCIEYCPKKVYEFSDEMNQKGYRLPHPARLADCSGCGLCDLYCPDFAILLERGKEAGRKEGKKIRCGRE